MIAMPMTNDVTQAKAMAQRMDREPTGHKRSVRLALAPLVVLLALPAAAEAKSFRGETSQNRLASVVVGEDGLVTRIRISYSAPCGDPRYRFPNVMRFEPPFDETTVDSVSEKVMLREKLSGGGRSRQTVTVTARRTVDATGAESWSGTFKTRAVLRRRGKRLDTCELKRVTWTAAPIAGEDPSLASHHREATGR